MDMQKEQLKARSFFSKIVERFLGKNKNTVYILNLAADRQT